MSTTRRNQNACPACDSRALVDGRILADGSEDGSAEKFFPSGIKLLTLQRSVRLVGRQFFRACTQCGHVWNTLDATELRALIESKGSDDLRKKLAERSQSTKS